jgi:hypothetical protein
MDIRSAPSPDQSQILKSLKSIDLIQYGVIAVGALTFLGYSHLSPKWKDEVTRNIGYLVTGAGVGARVLSHVAKKGRIEMGDLNDEIAQRVNLTDFEAARLPIVEKFLKGEKDLTDLPEVKTAIAAQFAAARPDMHQQVGQLLAAQQAQRVDPADLDRVNVPSIPSIPSLLDLSKEVESL